MAIFQKRLPTVEARQLTGEAPNADSSLGARDQSIQDGVFSVERGGTFEKTYEEVAA